MDIPRPDYALTHTHLHTHSLSHTHKHTYLYVQTDIYKLLYTDSIHKVKLILNGQWSLSLLLWIQGHILRQYLQNEEFQPGHRNPPKLL